MRSSCGTAASNQVDGKFTAMEMVETSDVSTQLSTPATPSGWLASWWRSRFGPRLAGEIAICAAMLVVYRLIRTVNKTDFRTAYDHANKIVQFEEWLGMPFEDDLQRWLLDHEPIIRFLNHYYIWFHFPAAILLLLWLFVQHPVRYRPVRNWMAVVTFVGLVVHLLFPLAPPRLIPGRFVDTMREFGPSIYNTNPREGNANQIAAMPSLHFGWAMIEAITVISISRVRWRWVMVLQPVLMTLAIIATGNHWWIDALAAGLLVVGAGVAGRLIYRWVGDRRWSWTAFRFQTRESIAKLESFANSLSHTPNRPAHGGQGSGEPSKVS